MKTFKLLIVCSAVLILSSCKTHPDYASDFRFPILSGDISSGEQSFIDLGCNRCHTVYEKNLPAYPGPQLVTLELGGELYFAKTYAELVTSIINPSHVLSDEYKDQLPENFRGATVSPMPFHSEMTVRQLVDIVTFLNASYRLLPGYSEEYYR